MNPLEKNKCNIECEWMKSKRALVNPDGQVWPCCYLANIAYAGFKKSELSNEPGNNFDYHVKHKSPTFNKYFENKDDNNIMKRSLEDIVNGEWFTKTLPESWNNEKEILPQCSSFCKIK